MPRTVDLVVVGNSASGMSAGIAAAQRGARVLIVLEHRDRSWIERLRRSIRASGVTQRITVMTGSELVCVDGIGGIEAIVVRRINSGRLTGINAQALLIETRE